MCIYSLFSDRPVKSFTSMMLEQHVGFVRASFGRFSCMTLSVFMHSILCFQRDKFQSFPQYMHKKNSLPWGLPRRTAISSVQKITRDLWHEQVSPGLMPLPVFGDVLSVFVHACHFHPIFDIVHGCMFSWSVWVKLDCTNANPLTLTLTLV
jgi:hypothetical protein